MSSFTLPHPLSHSNAVGLGTSSSLHPVGAQAQRHHLRQLCPLNSKQGGTRLVPLGSLWCQRMLDDHCSWDSCKPEGQMARYIARRLIGASNYFLIAFTYPPLTQNSLTYTHTHTHTHNACTKLIVIIMYIPALSHETVDCPGGSWGRGLAVTLGYPAHNLE